MALQPIHIGCCSYPHLSRFVWETAAAPALENDCSCPGHHWLRHCLTRYAALAVPPVHRLAIIDQISEVDVFQSIILRVSQRLNVEQDASVKLGLREVPIITVAFSNLT